jgi:hypothetical protein
MFPLLAGTVFGEPIKTDTAAFTLGEVVVTSEKIQEYIKNHPLDVNIVERKEIVGRNLPNVEEILKTMPGVEVYSTSGIGSRISIRGSGRSSGVLILLNGRPLNSNQHGSQDLNSIPVDMIESVSVFKPPVPVCLGPGGSDGAINIVTRAPKSMNEKEKHRTTVKGGGGSFGFIEGGVTHLLPVAGGNTLLSGTATHQDGKRANSDRTDGALSLNWDREGGAGAKYQVNGRYYQAEYGSPGPLDNLTPNARQEYRKGSVDTRYSGVMGESGTVAATAYGDLISVTDHSQSGATYSLDDHKLGLKIDTTWREPEGGWDLRVGGMTEWDTIDHSLRGEHQRFRNGISGQYDRRFGSLTATVGLRGDVTNDFGNIPIIYCMVLNPDPLLGNEDNITGISMSVSPERQLATLRKALPDLTKIAVVYNPDKTGSFLEKACSAAQKMGIKLVTVKVDRTKDFPRALETLPRDLDAFWMLPDSTVTTSEAVEALLLFSIRTKLPVFTFSDKYLRMGAFMSLELNTFELGKQAGEMAKKIRAGTAVENIPRAYADQATATVNQAVAAKFGIPGRNGFE